MALGRKNGIFVNLVVYIVWITVEIGLAHTDEVCIAEDFQATCNPSEIIFIDSALYGRMRLGRCVDKDYGHLGCNNDALDIFDKACSAKQTCEVAISDKLRREEEGACGPVIVGYAEVSYHCEQVHALNMGNCEGECIQLNTDRTLIASSTIKAQCHSAHRLKLAANTGQTMNISLWNFNGMQQNIGVLHDPVSSNTVELTSLMRYQEVYTSVGDVLEMDFHRLSLEDASFLIEVKVIGCADMSPPEGAWMSRDGNVIEVGCHAGSESWTLHCEDNQWIGVLGYCVIREERGSKDEVFVKTDDLQTISTNVLVFGVSSLIILLSACIFLAGVIVLKRKLAPKDGKVIETQLPLLPNPRYQNESEASLRMGNNTLHTTGNNSMNKSGAYKSLQMPFTAPRNDAHFAFTPDYSQYMNSTTSDVSEDSLKYFVLEDNARQQANA